MIRAAGFSAIAGKIARDTGNRCDRSVRLDRIFANPALNRILVCRGSKETIATR
jgi:hypothetical protein